MSEAEIIDRRTSTNPIPGPTPEQLAELASAKPLGKNILVRRIKDTYTGLIQLADIAQEKPVRCEVVSVSDAITSLAPGDKILIRRYSGSEIEVGGQELAILHVEDILLKF
jgi:chaperonin GroES